jgi:acyl carrier protein
MNPKQEILTLLQRVICEELLVRTEQITEQATWTQLGADSLDRLSISLAIEDAFKIQIPHQVGEQLNTVGETVNHLLTVTQGQFEQALR